VDHIKASIIIQCFCTKIIDLVYEKSPDPELSNQIQNAKQLLAQKYAPQYLYKSVMLIKKNPSEDIIENLEELFITIA